MTFLKGQTVRSKLISTVLGTGDADPATVRFKYRRPDGTSITKEFGVDSDVVKTATGRYQSDVDLDTAGTWRWRWEGVDTNAAATGSWQVIADPLA